MTYIPHTEDDIQQMLEKIGKEHIGELFVSIPQQFRLNRPLNLPTPLSEEELRKEFNTLASMQSGIKEYISFMGAGAYDHYIPSVIWHLLSRSEFYSAYTPYQPEISQGTLQALFEFQTLICQLTGMEVANASMYDGASSAAEAVLMALRLKKRKRFLVAESLHPEYRKVVETYCQNAGAEREIIPFGTDGVISQEVLQGKIKEDVACFVLQSPNFFGCIEDIVSFRRITEFYDVLLIVVITEPLSLAILKPPGEMGADIVVGELQSFGIPLNYGGPYAGFFATRRHHVRHMPGRIVGQTIDHSGQRGFVLTLSTREQHIRREKATSNICTNNNLCALASTIYMSLLGKNGLRELGRRNFAKTEYAKAVLPRESGCKIPFSSPTFNEFVLELPEPATSVLSGLRKEFNILGGMVLEKIFPHLTHHVLISVTERRSKDDLDRFHKSLRTLLGR